MTGQDLFNRMELFNAELQLQPNEADVARGLIAINVAQDHFETLVALQSKAFGGSIGVLNQTAATESTPWPPGLMRLDRLQFLDPVTGRPSWDLTPLKRTGAHSPSQYWPYNLLVQSAPGTPRAYFSDGSNIYWDPLPDSSSNQVRWYGFVAAPDITVSGTYAYPNYTSTGMAGFAARLMKTSLDDDASQIGGLAEEFFGPILKLMGEFNRDRASELEYTRLHEA